MDSSEITPYLVAINVALTWFIGIYVYLNDKKLAEEPVDTALKAINKGASK